MPHSLACLAIVLLLSGCATSNTSTYPPVDVDDVVVYESSDDIPGEFEVLSEVEPRRGPYAPLTSSQAIEDGRRQAAALGANGLLLLSGDDTITDARIRQAATLGGTVNRTGMVAIRVFPGTVTE